MWRAFFLAIGISAIIMGAECLAIEKAIFANPWTPNVAGSVKPAGRELSPPEWAPWGLLSGGAVVVLYSFMLPRRVASAK